MTKNNYLRKERRFPLYPFFALALLLATGCQKQPILNFGPNFVPDNGSANVVVVDTGLVSMSTVYTDSVNTAASGFLMVGTYNDSYLGKITSRAFLQVAPPPGLPHITTFDSYDSIALIMLFKKGNPYYGDTTLSQSFTINQVSSLYQLASFQRAFFSNSSFPLSSDDWGTAAAVIAPSIPFTSQRAGDTVKIRMPDTLGINLYNMIFNNDANITKPENWLNFFHGICVSPAPGSQGAIYGFQDSAVMRIYYHEAAAITTQKFIDFQLTNKSFQFNNITVDRTATPTQNLISPPTGPNYYAVTPPATPSGATGNASYLDGMLGLNVKLTFPTLNAIANRADYIGLLRAQLVVRPVPSSYTTTWRLPPQVSVSFTDLNNLPIAPIPSSVSSAAQTGSLVVDYLNPLNTVYTYDITNFIKSQITNTTYTANQNGVMLSIPEPASTTSFNRAVLADFSNPVTERVTLSVYYISLYPHQ